jgi:hypothetical protein
MGIGKLSTKIVTYVTTFKTVLPVPVLKPWK